MKKFLLFILLSSMILPVFAEDKFAKSLRACTPYVEVNKSEIFGMSVSSAMRVVGRIGYLCGLQTSITTPSGSVNVECNLTDEQIEEIVTSMEENSSEIESASKQSLDMNPQISENPAVSVLNKYLSDPNVCTVKE